MTSVARMYYLDGLGQHEIAGIFGVSRSTVSRLLTAARDQRIVRIAVDDYDPRIAGLEARLIERFGLTRAVVIHGIDAQAASARRAVGYFAAPIVAGWLDDRARVGVAGGRTIAQLVHFMDPQIRRRPFDVVQLMGTIGSAPSSVDASELSRALARRFNGAFHAINAPVFMDDSRSRGLLLSHAQIQSVWTMFPTLDMTFVGVGTLEDSVFAERQVLTTADLEALRRLGAVGEICGRFFDRQGRECASDLRDRVIGVELETLRERSDVVAVSAGASRAAAIGAAMAGGIVDALVIDDVGARALLGEGTAVGKAAVYAAAS